MPRLRDDAIPMAKSFSFQYRTWINHTTCNVHQKQNEGRKSNHASSTRQQSFRDGLNDVKMVDQNPHEKNKVKHLRTGGLSVLTPDAETPEVSQPTVSPDLL